METHSDPLRVRINVSTSTKGVATFDCTVEMSGLISEDLEGQVLRRSDALVAQLQERYGPVVLVKAGE
ncbi:MAG: hypothetical protein Q8P59_02800 [Dehalococcoidia bacterium]|nr:hypothetical protein [Dehalococcoidia bacterium]